MTLAGTGRDDWASMAGTGSSRQIKIYDTTLRDGTQGEGVAFSMEDKVRIAQRLDALGVHYIEGGWPGSNPKDLRFFKRVQDAVFKSARISAFGATRRPGVRPQDDGNIQSLVEAGPPVVTIFGKAWDFHVTSALGTTLEENVAMIADSVAYLLKHFEEVIYDAEHFFDGYKRNPEYAMRTLLAAEAAGAHCLVLCDTNGGSLPHEVVSIIREVKRMVKAETPLGIHVHNDTECAVATSLAAVGEGIGHVQGTINGYGERCGNANLVSIIPNLMIKMGFATGLSDAATAFSVSLWQWMPTGIPVAATAPTASAISCGSEAPLVSHSVTFSAPAS